MINNSSSIVTKEQAAIDGLLFTVKLKCSNCLIERQSEQSTEKKFLGYFDIHHY